MSEIYIARSHAVAARSLDGEMMIMSAKDSTLFTLNPAATLIWQSADGKTPLSEVVRRICAEFEIEAGEAMTDAMSFVTDIAAHGLLTVSDEAIDLSFRKGGQP